jgi:hypothetical protein
VPVGPRTVEATAPVALTAIPDPRKRLSDGILLEASIQARVLGLRLLTLDATVVLVPARATAPSPAAHPPPERLAQRSSGTARGRSVTAGPRLAQAVRSITEAKELLAESRRDGA